MLATSQNIDVMCLQLKSHYVPYKLDFFQNVLVYDLRYLFVLGPIPYFLLQTYSLNHPTI